MKDTCVIIPTIRDYWVVKNYVKNAQEHNFDIDRLHFLLITEDFCEKEKMSELLRSLEVDGDVFGNKERLEWMKSHGLGNFSSVIPNKSHAETSFGLLWMLAEGSEYGFFIDDDTLPTQDDFFGRHIKNLNFSGDIEEVSSDTGWVNVLYQSFQRHKLYPRGYPYSCMNEKTKTSARKISNVTLSQGMWINNPDLDAIRILNQGGLNGVCEIKLAERDFARNFIAAKGNYKTVCSMNLAFKKEIIPAFYQLPMDDNIWKIGRFEDIWSGIFIKRICDTMDKNMISGFPLCVHNKVPRSTFKDLMTEGPAMEINEFLWKIVDGIDFNSKDYFGMYAQLADTLERGEWKFLNGEFLNFMGARMNLWLTAVEKLS